MRNLGFGSIAYISDRGGAFDLWLYRPLEALHYPLTQGVAEEFSVPFWSPDGRKVALIGRNNIIYIIDTRTGSVAQIDQTEPYTLLDWSPNSWQLCYVKSGRIRIYDTKSHTSREIVQENATDAQWFPSGKELLFTAPDSTGMSQLYSIRIDGTNKRQLTQNMGNPIHHLRLSPDGRYALFTYPGVSVSLIGIANLSTGHVETLPGGPLGKNYNPQWSPASSLVAYSATSFSFNRYHSLLQTDHRTGQQQKTWAVSSCYSTPVSWSPDGARIAYLSGCGNSERATQIWVVSLRNPVPFKIVEGGRITALQWSPFIPPAPPMHVYFSRLYRVSFPYPAIWSKMTHERYEGKDGFFQVSAVASDGGIDEVCRGEAYHILAPYGSRPQIQMTSIQNQPACFIFPSEDQPKEMNNQAALIVKYPHPVTIQGIVYSYFLLWADRSHIGMLARGLKLV
ncbi:PD40 domain-containing protein [Ammoniphilus sp. YIM 78166]|uniref:TolB family protein n=1 Tax=Ammoniphilus sp. YIM 78166 TaxID=1644106 RepID=UPI0010703178|nr:PD40 domain-containing protein [Ammoniphilus sp. YIM 78166]